MIERPTTVEDVRSIEPSTHQDRLYAQQLGRDEAALFLKTYAVTLEHEDKPVAIGGVTPMWTGVGDLWVIMTDEAYRQPAVTARHLRLLVDQAREVILAHRLQATVAVGHERMAAFLEHLDFKQEGILRAYYEPDKDYWLYAKVWREPLKVQTT